MTAASSPKQVEGNGGNGGYEEDLEKDDSSGDWDLLCTFLREGLEFVDECLADGRTVLIHDDEGSNFATAFLAIWMCTRKRIRINDATKHLQEIRREGVLSAGMTKGLKKFQETLDTRKLKRLEERLRNSDVVSIGF